MMNPLLEIPKFEWVGVDKIKAGKFQPRQVFSDQSIQELASSIALHGILQPLVLQSDYQLIAGERRWRAARFIGLKEVPCMVLRTTQEQHALLSILENVQREDIEPLEEALALKRLQQDFSWTQDHIAKMLGKSRPYVTNMLRLLKLSPEVQQSLKNKELTYGHAKILVGLAEDEQRHFLYELKKMGCNVRQFEKMVAGCKKKNIQVQDKNTHFLQSICEQVGTDVKLEVLANGEGWLKFKFFNQDTLEGLLERLGLRYD